MADTDVFGDTTEQMSTEDITPAAADPPKEDITEHQEDDDEPQAEKTIKEELLKEETEDLSPDSIVKETVDENGDVFEETTEVSRKVVKRTMKITETSSTTKTTTMTTPAKLYGKDLSEYDEVDVDALLAQLSPEEINILAKEVDPDDNFLPPNQRCSYECTKDPTGPLNRKKLIEHINKEALETPDLPEIEPFVKGTVRGKKWVPPPRDERDIAAEEQIAIDMGDEYEHALSDATQEEIIDLAAILGFHSMMNQDQYHASLLNKGQPVGMGWDGITKSTTQKLYPMDPPNNTDVEESIKRVKDDDPKLIELNLNNIKNISDEKFQQLFDALPQNEHLEVLSLTNVGLTDKTALLLAEAIEKSKTLRVLNVETNFINPPVIVTLVKTLLKARTIEEFRASNQRSTVLGNKIEMEITDLVEKNTSLLRLGLHLEFNDARHRVAAHLQRNIDRNEHELRKGTSLSPIPNATSVKAAGTAGDLSSMLKAKSPTKPKHIVLTPQDRIDSKSELIAALENQKLNDSGRGEVSLAVPQAPVKALSRSPPNDRVNSAKDRRSPANLRVEPPRAVEIKVKPIEGRENLAKEKRSPVREKEVSPKIVDANSAKDRRSPVKEKVVPPKVVEIDVKAVEERRASPTRHPKLGELRHSNMSRAVDEESISKQESGGPPKIDDISPPENGVPKEAVDTKIQSNDLIQNETENNDMIATPQINVSLDVVNPDQLTLPDLSANRESISPSRRLEDKMILLQAKIDSFAEVADEKLSSLRSKFDDLAKDTTLDRAADALKKLEVTSPPKETAPKSDDLVKPIITAPETVDPITLPPKAPQKSEKIPKVAKVIPVRPLIRTPNSVGITFLYQRQLAPKPEAPSKIVQAMEPELKKTSPVNEDNVQFSEKNVESKSEANEKITDRKEDRVNSPENPNKIVEPLKLEAIPDRSVSDRVKPPQKVDKVDLPSEEPSIKQIVEPSKALGDISDVSRPIDQSIKLSETSQEPMEPIQKVETPKQTPETPIEVSGPKLPTQASDVFKPDPIDHNVKTNPLEDRKIKKQIALALLSVKKGEILNIDPVKTAETATQSPAKPSPLSRLSVKKGDTQKIDPPKLVEVATQSPITPNPMTLLSVNKRDLVKINPITKFEVSTQFLYKEPIAEASSQTEEKEPIKTIEEATQTPLVFSSLEHDYIFPGLRRVPHLPRPKTINIGSGDRVIVKPSSKPINEVLMVLYPPFHDYSNVKPQIGDQSTRNFGLEEDLLKVGQADNTIKELEETLLKATEISESILSAVPEIKPDSELEKAETNNLDKPVDDSAIASTTRFETKYTAVEKVSALSRTTIASEAHVEVIDKAYESVAQVSSSEGEHVSKTSIRSANMWESLSSNLIKASEQTLIDISKAAEIGKIGKVSVYSSVEDLSRTSRSKYADRQFGGLIKTVEKTTVYSSTEDIPITAYTRYSDRYNDATTKSKVSVYSSTEDLQQSSSRTKHSDRFASDLLKSSGKRSVYSSTEDLPEISYTKYSDRYSDAKGKDSYYSLDDDLSDYAPKEDYTTLPRSKFSDRYKDDHVKSVDIPRTPSKFPVAQTLPKSGRSYYKDEYSSSRSLYKSSEDLSYKSNITDRSSQKYAKSHDYSLQSAILSSISQNQSALRPYTYVPSSIYTDLAIDHVPSRPISPSVKHTSTLQLNISPTGIRESTPRRHYNVDNPKIVVSRPKDEKRSIRALSPFERSRGTSNLLSPYHKISDRSNDAATIIDESSQSTLDISSASAASAAELNASTSSPTTATDTPKKRANIMDTIKMLKNRVRDVITTEDRFTESHRLPTTESSASVTSRAARTFATTTSSSLNIPHDNDEKEI